MNKHTKVFHHSFNVHTVFRRAGTLTLVFLCLAALAAVSNNSSRRWSAAVESDSFAATPAVLAPALVDHAASLKAEAARQEAALIQQAEPLSDMLYFNSEAIASSLACPAPNREDRHLNFTCFFHNPSEPYSLAAVDTMDSATGCQTIFRPLPADDGRPWCIPKLATHGHAVSDAMQGIPAADKLHLKGTTLLLGTLSGPNPTHQLNIHFYHVYIWMKEHNIPVGSLNIVADCYTPEWCLGTYGTGLAKALGPLHFLPQLPSLTTFDRVKFSMSTFGFPFDIHKYELDKALDCNFIELLWGVKQHYGLDPMQPANPRKVVLAVRKPTESRALSNIPALAEALHTKGFEVTIATFGDLSFQEQLDTVADAAVLVGVTGSDLINLAFLPLTGSVVEIFPVALGKQVFTPELWNLAHMTGKNHLKYVSPYNSSLMLDAEGNLISDRPVHQANSTEVHVPGLVALIEAAALAADPQSSVWNRIRVEPNLDGKGVRCFDHTV